MFVKEIKGIENLIESRWVLCTLSSYIKSEKTIVFIDYLSI